MEIVVLSEVLFGNDARSIPVETEVVDELMILVSEEEPVLPIFLVLIEDLLLNFGSDGN
jgi:hypothetical protein